MIQLSNSTAQTLAPGASLIFDDVLNHTGCCECHRKNTSSVKMRSNGSYAVEFHGNIGATAPGVAQLAMQLSGETTLPETTMISTTAAAGDLNNVGASTIIRNCCGDFDRVSITNTGTTEITVGANSSFIVKKYS